MHVILEKAKIHKYVKKLGAPGYWRYFYDEKLFKEKVAGGKKRIEEIIGKPKTTIEAYEIGKQLTKEEAIEVWKEYKRRKAEPRPIDLQEWSNRAFEDQLIREEVEGFLLRDLKPEGRTLRPGEIDEMLGFDKEVIKSFIILEKARPHKYIKREGTKGKYVYFYKESKSEQKQKPIQISFPFIQPTLEKVFTSGKTKSSYEFSGGCNKVIRIQIEDNGEGILKPQSGEKKNLRTGINTYYNREIAAYEIAKLVGLDDLVPETYLRDDPEHGKSSLQEFVDGVCGIWDIIDKDLEKAALFDYVINNTDRHGMNWIVRNKDGKLQLIDNGLCLPTVKTWTSQGLFEIASSKKLKIPIEFVAIFLEKEEEIIKKLKHFEIEDEAIKLFRERLDYLKKEATHLQNFSKFREKIKTIIEENDGI